MFMDEFCQECGAKLKKDGSFCPNCGRKVNPKSENEVSYIDLIRDIIFINDNGSYRLSKAKLLGVLIFACIFFYFVFDSASFFMRHALSFFFIILTIFISGLFWYGICRGVGYLIRTYAAK